MPHVKWLIILTLVYFFEISHLTWGIFEIKWTVWKRSNDYISIDYYLRYVMGIIRIKEKWKIDHKIVNVNICIFSKNSKFRIYDIYRPFTILWVIFRFIEILMGLMRFLRLNRIDIDPLVHFWSSRKILKSLASEIIYWKKS